MNKLLLRIGMLCSMLLALSALADSWVPPSVQSYSSANREWKLTVYPSGHKSQRDYFKDKAEGSPDAGGVAGEAKASPIGHMKQKQDGHWRTVWKGPLVNKVAPAHAILSNEGMTATFDNWYSAGWGDDAVVIYAADGRRVRKFGLAEFLPKHYINALPRTISSIHWRGEPRIDESARQLVIPVVVPSVNGEAAYTDKARFVDARFLLADGSPVPLAGEGWAEANALAEKENARLKKLQAEALQRFASPLVAPADNDVWVWHLYLVEAYFRINGDSQDGYPTTQIVPLPSDPDFDTKAGYLGAALGAKRDSASVIMIASPSQDGLVNALQEQARRATPGALAKARIYVAADNAHMPVVRAALAHTGANIIQLDIDTSIPQRKERLDRYLQDRAE